MANLVKEITGGIAQLSQQHDFAYYMFEVTKTCMGICANGSELAFHLLKQIRIGSSSSHFMDHFTVNTAVILIA